MLFVNVTVTCGYDKFGASVNRDWFAGIAGVIETGLLTIWGDKIVVKSVADILASDEASVYVKYHTCPPVLKPFAPVHPVAPVTPVYPV